MLRLRQNVKVEAKWIHSSEPVREHKQQQGSASEELPRLQSTGLLGSKLTGRLVKQDERQRPCSRGLHES